MQLDGKREQEALMLKDQMEEKRSVRENELNKDLEGIVIGDAAYCSEKLAREYYQEKKRILLAKPKKNMKKLLSSFQYYLYKTRAIIEINFNSLKRFYNLITSLPRSVNGYLANYIYSLLSYLIA